MHSLRTNLSLISYVSVQRHPRLIHNETVGFVGLGNMGSYMTRNLLKKERNVVVYDLKQNLVSELESLGAQKAFSSAEVASKCGYVVTMLPEDKDVLEVYTGTDGLLSNIKAGTYLIDSSTVDPQTSQQINHTCSQMDVNFIDAPVTGATPAAKAGTLNFLCGGKAVDIEAITEVLLCMGSRVVHVGDVGFGGIAKICNNLVVAITMIGVSETLNLADRLGLNPKLMNEILSISSGRTWVSEIYNPVPNIVPSSPSSSSYEQGFATKLMAKDTSLAQKLAIRSKSAVPLGSMTQSIYRIMDTMDAFNEKDFSIVYQFLKIKEVN